MYIILEGIDTAGKSTQLDIIKQNHPEAFFTKEPGGTDIGLELREMVLNARASSKIAEMFLFLADRAEHYEQVVKQNDFVISDRGFISGIAYAKDFDMDMTIELNKIALDNTMPDCVIMLKLSQEELKYRLSQKEIDGIEARGTDYLLEIQSRMEQVINKLDINSLIVDASEPIEQIAQKIEEFINGVKNNG
jgi:dTMP kinase